MAEFNPSSSHAGHGRHDAYAAAPFRYQSHATLDSDEHAHSLVGWEQTYSQMTAGAFSGQVVDLGFLGMQVFRETTNQAVFQQGSPMAECFVIALPLAMDGHGVFCRKQFGTSDLFTCVGRQNFSLVTPHQFDVLAVTVPKDELTRLLALEQSDVAVLARPGVLRPGAAPLRALRNCLLSVMNPNEFDTGLLGALQIQRIVKSAVLTASLSAIESARPADEPSRSFKAHSHLVREIVDWAMSRADDPPSIADICLQFNVGRRLLNYSFVEVLGTTPLHHLRALRLNGARRHLRLVDTELSIRDVAGRWGFWHLPRFSDEYRKLFGELPSETRRRAGGGT